MTQVIRRDYPNSSWGYVILTELEQKENAYICVCPALLIRSCGAA